MSAIPPCPIQNSNENCKELEKLYEMGFVIGYEKQGYGGTRQGYAAFRYRNNEESADKSSIAFVKSDNEMPFNMSSRSLIRMSYSNFWPIDGTDQWGEYLAVTYDETDYSILFLVKKKFGGLTLFVRHLTDLEEGNYQGHQISDNNINIRQYLGFIQWDITETGIRKTFVVLNVGQSYTALAFELEVTHNDSIKGEKQHFIDQVFID